MQFDAMGLQLNVTATVTTGNSHHVN